MSPESSTSSDKRAFEIGAAIELLKGVGVVVGSVGGLAVLFFWIGNAIIVARLRAYNLYGVVRYTEEYVNEAGYQFFQDIFTFFQDWRLLLLFLVAAILVVFLIPVGPFTFGAGADFPPGHGVKRILARIRGSGTHYGLFFFLALSASISLTSNLGLENLSKAIEAHYDRLNRILEYIKARPLFFEEIPESGKKHNFFQKDFYEHLTVGEEPTLQWLSQSLTELYKDGTANLIEQFQQDFKIKEKSQFESDEEVKKSQTARVLLGLRLSQKLDKLLREKLGTAASSVRSLLLAHRTSGEDYSSLVVVPANYERVNELVQETKILYRHILASFRPVDAEFAKSMSDLSAIEPLRFGSVLLSFSFWVLIGIMAYLFLNVPNVLKFHHWEMGYFFLMLLLFLTILITLPTAYGRYKFEFQIQKVNDIIFAEDDSNNPIKKKVKELWEGKAVLYLLGPTRGKEVIVGAIESDLDPNVGGPQILILDKETFRFMNVEPVQVEDIQRIIKILKRRGRS